MTTNIDLKLKSYRDRVFRLDQEKRQAAEALRDLRKEMKSNGLSASEIDGIFVWLKRQYLDADKAAKKSAAEDVADMLEAAGVPLFAAASAA